MNEANRKRGRSAKRKGSEAERQVRDLIQAWWRQLEPECTFARTPQSGGWAAPKVRGDFKVAGDLTTTAKRWPFTLEVKRRENWSTKVLLAGRPSPAWDWWGQVLEAAAEERSHPMLWMRQSGSPWLVMLESKVWRRFGLPEEVVSCPDLTLSLADGPCVVGADAVLAVDPGQFAQLKAEADHG